MSRLQNTQYVLEGLPDLMELDTGLRKSQRRVLNTYLEADMDKKQTGIFNLATGFGKTRMMSILALAYKRANPKGKVLIVVPSTSLIKDENGDGVVKKFHVYNKKDLKSGNNLDFGTYYGKGIKSTETEFTVTTYSSLAKYVQKINPKDIGLLLLDEAHHALSETRSETIRQFSNAAQYGMTATPGYDSEKNLVNLLENQIAEVTIEEAIKEGDLADTKNVILVSGTPVDLTKVPKVRGSSGDYDPKEYMKAIARAMNGNSIDSGNEDNWKDVHRRISEQIAEFYRDYEDDEAGKIFGKKCMINCRSQEEARITALSINKIFGKMMAATYVSGNKGTENETVLNSFVGGNLPILCQVGKLSEGFNYPDLDIVFNFPTHSRVREAQLGGRAIRTPSDRKRKKTALIVDIAFTHPDAKNVIQGIHKNGQVLFQDIMGEPIIQKGKGPGGGGGRGKGKPTIRLKDFNIISNKQTLFYLSQEAKRIEEEEYVPPIRPGMRTANDFYKEFGISPQVISPLLKEACEKKLTFNTLKERNIPCAYEVEKQGVTCVALNNHPKALEVFIKWVIEVKKKDILLPRIRPGMRTAKDFEKEYGIHSSKVNDWFKECFNDKEKNTFYLPSDVKHKHPYNLVQLVKSKKGKPCLALDEHPEALEIFSRMYPKVLEAMKNKDIPSIRPGMRTITAFSAEFGIQLSDARKYFKECFNDKEKNTFYLPSDVKHKHPYDLIQLVKPKFGPPCLALDEHPEALEIFLRMYPKISETMKNKEIPSIRPGMLPIGKLTKIYGISYKRAQNYLRESLAKKIVFYLKSDKDHKHRLPLFELVKNSGGHDCYALHEAPEAREKLEKLYPELLELKRKKEIPPIRPGMRTAKDLYKEFGIHPRWGRRYFEECIEKEVKFFLDSDVKQENSLDLVIRVKSGSNTSLALHEKGLEAFKKWLKKTYGVELKERTTSPTLRARLKAGSDKGKPKAPPIRKRSTPEI